MAKFSGHSNIIHYPLFYIFGGGWRSIKLDGQATFSFLSAGHRNLNPDVWVKSIEI